jgi:hypothetical protein
LVRDGHDYANENYNEYYVEEKFAGEVQYRPQANKQGFSPISLGRHILLPFSKV